MSSEYLRSRERVQTTGEVMKIIRVKKGEHFFLHLPYKNFEECIVIS